MYQTYKVKLWKKPSDPNTVKVDPIEGDVMHTMGHFICDINRIAIEDLDLESYIPVTDINPYTDRALSVRIDLDEMVKVRSLLFSDKGIYKLGSMIINDTT